MGASTLVGLIGPAQAQITGSSVVTPAALFTVPACLPSGLGVDYHVGPGLTYPTLDSVPWEKLGPGDTVRLEYNNGVPYTGKMIVAAKGTAAAPVRICGIRGPANQRPEIDGRATTTRAALLKEYGNPTFDPALGMSNQDLQQSRAVIMINSLYTSQASTSFPSNIQIDGLAIRHAHPSYTYISGSGLAQIYSDFSAGIWIHKGQNITVADNEISDCVQAVFSRSTDLDPSEVTRNIRISGNYFWGHGIVGSDLAHTTYTESVGMVSEFNRYGALRAGALGHSVKDRSAGTVVRYNLIEDGGHAIDLVESEDFPVTATAEPAYRSAFVYGNLIVRNGDLGSTIHYGGDHFNSTPGALWGEPIFRQGTLYFYNNSVHVTTGLKSWMFQLSTTLETAEVFNNVFVYDSVVTGRTMRAPQVVGAPWISDGVLNLGRNWTNTGWVDYYTPLNGPLNGTANLISAATAPVTINTMVPLSNSTLVDAAIALPAAASLYPVLYQIDVNGLRSARTTAGLAPDLGALEGPATTTKAKTTATTAKTTTPAAATPAPAPAVAVAATQKITLTAPTKLALNSSAAVTATSTSGLAVTITSTTPTICSVTAGTVFAGARAGTCTLAADQAGNASWKAATQVTAKITVK